MHQSEPSIILHSETHYAHYCPTRLRANPALLSNLTLADISPYNYAHMHLHTPLPLLPNAAKSAASAGMSALQVFGVRG